MGSMAVDKSSTSDVRPPHAKASRVTVEDNHTSAPPGISHWEGLMTSSEWRLAYPSSLEHLLKQLSLPPTTSSHGGRTQHAAPDAARLPTMRSPPGACNSTSVTGRRDDPPGPGLDGSGPPAPPAEPHTLQGHSCGLVALPGCCTFPTHTING